MQNNINNSLVLQKYFGQKLTQVNLWTLSGAIGGRIGEACIFKIVGSYLLWEQTTTIIRIRNPSGSMIATDYASKNC